MGQWPDRRGFVILTFPFANQKSTRSSRDSTQALGSAVKAMRQPPSSPRLCPSWLEGPTDRSRRPYRQANQLPFQIEALIVQLTRERPSWGAPKIREKLRRLHSEIPSPAISTVFAQSVGVDLFVNLQLYVRISQTDVDIEAIEKRARRIGP